MHISLAVCFAVQGFFPHRDEWNLIKYQFNSYEEAVPLISFITSVLSSAFGMSKFLLEGPIPFLSKKGIAGIMSRSFFMMIYLNIMFGQRILCIENILFTSYVFVDYSNWKIGSDTYSKTIQPLIPVQYRILFYFLPGLISLMINVVKLTMTSRKKMSYFIKYPQFLLSPCFSPIMFEGVDTLKEGSRIRIWKFGSIINALFIGCMPQIFLICFEFYKGTPTWNFIGGQYKEENEIQISKSIFEVNDALIKHPYGNIIFGGVTFILNLTLISIFFFTDSLDCDPDYENTEHVNVIQTNEDVTADLKSNQSIENHSNTDLNEDCKTNKTQNSNSPKENTITQELDKIDKGTSEKSTNHSTDESTKNKEFICCEETKQQGSLTHNLKEMFDEPPNPVVELSNIDKIEKEEQDNVSLDYDYSKDNAKKHNENSTKQGLKSMRSSYLLDMLVSRQIRKH